MNIVKTPDGYQVFSLEGLREFQSDLPEACIVFANEVFADGRYIDIDQTKTKTIAKVTRRARDPDSVPGWYCPNTKTICFLLAESDTEEFDKLSDSFRVIQTLEGVRVGFVARVEGRWITKPSSSVRNMLCAAGFSKSEADTAMGILEQHPYSIDDTPFGVEYPEQGKRLWNRNHDRYFKVTPAPGDLTNTNKAFAQVGRGLDEAVLNSEGCKAIGIQTGADYLWTFLKICVQRPQTRLPWLTLYSHVQGVCGKSKIIELLEATLSRIAYKKGSQRQASNNWNDDQKGVAFVLLDECGIPGITEDELKQRVSDTEVEINQRNTTTHLSKNWCHYLQATNNPKLIPVFPNCSRVVVCEVPPLKLEDIDPMFIDKLLSEREAFAYELLNGDLPEASMAQTRLYLPVLETEAKYRIVGIDRPPEQIASQAAKNLRSFCNGGSLIGERLSSIYQMASPGISKAKFQALIRKQTFTDALNNEGLHLEVSTSVDSRSNKRKIYTITTKAEKETECPIQ